MTSYSYIEGYSNERFFIIEDYYYKGFEISIVQKESTGEFYGKIYTNRYEPKGMKKTVKSKSIEVVKHTLESYADDDK